MEINKVNNSPNFQAKIIVGDERVQKFIKSSFLANSKRMIKELDLFDSYHPEHIITINIRSMGKSNAPSQEYMLARNGITGKDSGVLLGNADRITPENRNAFYNLIKRMLKDINFWEKPIINSKFDAEAKDINIEHNVFKLDKQF